MAVPAYQGLFTLTHGVLQVLREDLAAVITAMNLGPVGTTIPAIPALAITLSDFLAPPQHPTFIAVGVEDGGGGDGVPMGQTEDRRLFVVRAIVGTNVQRKATVGGVQAAVLDGSHIIIAGLAQAVETALLAGIRDVGGVYAAQRVSGYPASAPRAFRSGAVLAKEVRVAVWMQAHHAVFP